MGSFLSKVKDKAVQLSLGAALLFLILSLVISPNSATLEREVAALQKNLQKREALLEEYALAALDIPAEKWIELENLPSDMVIYRYCADTLQSWANLFPMANDALSNDSYYQIFRTEHYLDGQNRFNYPLSYLSSEEQFINIGSGWYLIKSFLRDNQRVVAGLLIKTDKVVAQAIDAPVINPKLKLNEGFDIEPITFESCGAEIKGKDGNLLFVLTNDVTVKKSSGINAFTWLALLACLLTICLYLYKKRSYTRFVLFLSALTLLRLLCFYIAGLVSYTGSFFSPSVYADSGIFSSIGNLLLNNLYVAFVVVGIYMLRQPILSAAKSGPLTVRWLIYLLLFALGPALFIYIDFTLRSLISNSSVVMVLHRITDLNIYTLLCYLSYALLFMVLLFSLQMLFSLLGLRRRYTLLSGRNILIYSLIVSLYTLLTVTTLSSKKEMQWCSLLANRLSIDRDLSLELELRSVEEKLMNDPISKRMLSLPKENLKLLEMRFSEIYFQEIKQRYSVSLTLCRPDEALQISQHVVNCSDYYRALLEQYDAVPIAEQSNFYYLSNFNGRVGYLGYFQYLTENGLINLYIELNTRYESNATGYPAQFSEYKQTENLNIPTVYAWAKYYRGRLVLYNGSYDYPIFLNEFDDDGQLKKDSFMHSINSVTEDNVVIISRPKRNILPYIVSFSYLVLFYFSFMHIIVRIRRARLRAVSARDLKRSFAKQITSLITIVLAVTLAAVAIGSIWYSVNFYRKTNRALMEEKLQAVQKMLTSYFTYAHSFNEVNSSDLNAAMERLANETHADINLYDPSGKLLRSTQMELFQKFVLSARMNPKAYADVVLKARSQIFNKERVGGFSYYSLYSPIYNYNGELLAIANLPYFTRGGNISGDLSYIVATIVNVSILLLILSILFGRALASNIAKPLTRISNKMKYMDVSSEPQYINYRKKDELGVLVESYNKMVDSLAESTKQMAQAEREKVWSDMARRIAHEIKNPLTPMKLSIQRLMMLKQKGSPLWQDKFEEVSRSILEQIDILSNTASEFSSFAKFYVEEDSLFNLYDVLLEQKVLFDTHDNIRLSLSYSSDNCPVKARKGQIIRVLVNLISNAVQELERSDSMGFIRLSLTKEDNFYVVSIDDNGNGVKEEDQEKLFMPNFTTKSSGNGLGLAISKSIVEQSGGRIWYSASELGGASFSFTLPVFDKTT